MDTRSHFGWNRKTFIPPLVVWVIGAIIYWQWQGWEAMKEEIFIAVAFMVSPILLYLLGVYFFNLIRAPVLIKWEKEKEPRLAVDGRAVCRSLNWVLRIKNEGTDRAEDCRGQPIEMDFLVPREDISLTEWLRNQRFQWAGESPSGGDFSIPGKSPAELIIMAAKNLAALSTTNDGLRLAYKGNELFNSLSYLPNDFKILIVISVTSQNRLPIYVVCLLNTMRPTFEKRLEVLKVTREYPRISDYQQSILDKEGSQTE